MGPECEIKLQKNLMFIRGNELIQKIVLQAKRGKFARRKSQESRVTNFILSDFSPTSHGIAWNGEKVVSSLGPPAARELILQ